MIAKYIKRLLSSRTSSLIGSVLVRSPVLVPSGHLGFNVILHLLKDYRRRSSDTRGSKCYEDRLIASSIISFDTGGRDYPPSTPSALPTLGARFRPILPAPTTFNAEAGDRYIPFPKPRSVALYWRYMFVGFFLNSKNTVKKDLSAFTEHPDPPADKLDLGRIDGQAHVFFGDRAIVFSN
ncbi:MAG: hypothetical protein ACXV2E_00945 [Halobacteriota archaeon]